jgi:predicted transcriptional regulator
MTKKPVHTPAPDVAPEKQTVTVELPMDLNETLRQIAKVEGRSLSGQIRFFLAQSVTRENTATATPNAAKAA